MELRVHGIGGPTAEAVLGRAADDRTVASWRSEPSARSSVRRARGDHDVHVYHWAPLTSGSRSFALWPLLLPFTLLNVSGWMHPPGRWWRSWQATAVRAGVALLGYALTAGTVVWFVLAGQVLARDRGLLPEPVVGWLPGTVAASRSWVGLAGAALAVALVAAVARVTARGYERYRRPSWDALPPRRRRRVWQWSRMPDLSDERFFDDARDHRWRWGAHLLVAVATLVVLVVALVGRGMGDVDAADEVVGWAVLVAGAAQGGVLALLVLALLPSGRRGLLLVATAGAGVLLAGGYTLSVLIALRGVEAVPPGPVGMLYDAYGWALGAALVVTVGVVVVRLALPAPVEGGPRRDELLRTVTARWRARLALVPARLEWVVVVAALAFLVAGAVAAVVRLGVDDRSAWQLTTTAPVRLAQLTLVLLVGAVVVNLWKTRADPAALRRVGTVWDVLTFWPRTYHPFAVRPYAERAVPELREYLEHLPHDVPLVIAAHDQGSVLAYAALLPLATGTSIAGRTGPTRLVTLGSPLRSVYARAFPHYVRSEDVRRLRQSLGRRGWVNAFRYTDHVGQALFSSAEHLLDDRGDVAVPDPSGRGDLRGHDHYWDDPAVRAVVDEQRGRPARTAEGARA